MSDNPVINDVEEEHDEFKVFENTSHSLVATRELQNMRLTGELIDCNLQVTFHLNNIKFGIIIFIQYDLDT